MESSKLSQLLACWAKRGRENGSISYHPLICHVVDVAMVAQSMWLSAFSPGQRRRLTKSLGFSEDQDAAGRWCAFLAGLHDLGKASPAFQCRARHDRQDIVKRLRESGLRCKLSQSVSPASHGTITAAVLPQILEGLFDLDPRVAKRIAVIVGGHHGVLPRSFDIQRIPNLDKGKGEWDALRSDMAKWLVEVLDVPCDRTPGEISNAAAMSLAGFVSVADWIGSNRDFFDYAYPSDLRAYKRDAMCRARKALDELGWGLQPTSGGIREFTDLFRHISEPNDLQRTIESCTPELEGPGLVIVEAPMGEGKTEAAMYLADYWAASAGHQGHYFALPTQATSNQMFGRVRDFLNDRYEGDQVQLQLLHGHASLSSEFELLRRNHRAFVPTGIEQDADRSGVVAAEWFTYRKRGLLAPFGVGTIDQALMAVLQTRHVFVRLFGLAGKTVIVDEVHAYDAYMTTLLERLLEWLAALGASVVLLSATLPKNRQKALLNAYRKGLGDKPPCHDDVAEYPRISWTSARTPADSRTVGVSRRGEKAIALEWTDGSLPGRNQTTIPLGEVLQAALAQGGCAAVICNTVRRAQDVYQALKPYFPHRADDGHPELDLLHARYLFEGRQERERRSLVRFGKPQGTVTDYGGKERATRRPGRAVLVATQIIEQSLDLDFDLMVSDLAPADLLLQRSGRLHRHERHRPPGLEHPRLLVCQPGMDGCVPRFDPGTAAVYDEHVLLRSWLALRDQATIRVPQGVVAIIEQVYDDRSSDDVPDRLRETWEATRKCMEAAKERELDEAKDRWIKAPSYTGQLWRLAPNPREEDSPDFHRAHQAVTRLAPPSAAVVVLFGNQDAAFLDADDSEPVDMNVPPSEDLMVRLLRRSVSISDRRLVFQLLEQSSPKSWRSVALLRNHRAVFLDGAQVSNEIGAYRIVLDDEVGVRVVRASEV